MTAAHTPPAANGTTSDSSVAATGTGSMGAVGSNASAGAASAARADAELRREGRSPIVGYLLTIPPSFSSADGAFDLVVHFHGNWDIVEESFAVAQVNAVVVMVQSGNGMRSYLGSFASPRDFEGIVKRSGELLAERGLKNPHLRRIAVTSWSAGYGSIMQLIRQPEHVDRLAAIIALDGVQGRLVGGEVDPQEIAPLVAIARQAMKGERMLLLTHTAIPNAGEMGSTTASIGGLLKILGVAESPLARAVDMKPLPSTLASLPARMLTNCEQVSEGRWGDFTVRGYAGFRPEDHNAELQQIAAIALPDLKRYLEAAH